MQGNDTITYYQYLGTNGYKRMLMKNVFYFPSKIANVNKTGAADADSASVFIPYGVAPQDFKPTLRKDLIVPGNCLIDVAKSSEQAQAESLKALKEAGGVTVMQCDPKKYGSKELWHYQLSCK